MLDQIKMKKMIIGLLNPFIEKMAKERETRANMIKSQGYVMTHLGNIGAAVYN
jgi:hypothetical protein